jgi:hypothetical protein
VMKDAYSPNVLIRMVTIPSFIPENAVGLVTTRPYGKGPPYRIFAVMPSKSLWISLQHYQSFQNMKRGNGKIFNRDGVDITAAELKRREFSPPHNPADIPVKRCQIDIDNSLAQRITRLWLKVLSGTRYPRVEASDAPTFHFAYTGPAGAFAGRSGSPGPDNIIPSLVSIADSMRDLCMSNTAQDHDQLIKATADLENKLR